jgi:hypothetical protein
MVLPPVSAKLTIHCGNVWLALILGGNLEAAKTKPPLFMREIRLKLLVVEKRFGRLTRTKREAPPYV